MSELIDRQALLDECLNHYEVGNIEQNCTMDWICKTVRNFPAASPWHRVEEPPKPFEMVIAYVDPWHIFAAYHNGHGAWKENDGFKVIGVRYWMPIEPPKEDA